MRNIRTYILLPVVIFLLSVSLLNSFAGTQGRHTARRYTDTVTACLPAHKSPTGIIISGRGDSVRALEPFCGVPGGCMHYADAVNRYDETFGDSIRIYCMVIPTAVEYYCPDTARTWTRDELPVINGIYEHLSQRVRAVDVYTALGNHVAENIYARTDHHWLPLGAYYAAEEFARIAGVPFRTLGNYDSHVIRNFVGTMYRFSKDISVKHAPEEFIYYTPRDVEYTTTSIAYTLDRSRWRVVSETAPVEKPFFRTYADGSSAAYCTFMGGDTNLTVVRTSTRNGRRLLVLKDSFGNALPGYLFHSFEEIHVVDCRYFTKNIKDYIGANGITDILFANNIGHACSLRTSNSYNHYLTKDTD